MPMKEKPSLFVSALILMGGKGERFGSALPKQFHLVSGKPLYLHTLEKFLSSHLFQEILLVCMEEWHEKVQKQISRYEAPIKIVKGGETRRESSYLGLLACSKNTDYVVIHDAVRPFVSHRILKENIDNAIEHKAVDTCIPSADTLVHAPDSTFIQNIPPRNEYLRGQTPQSFAYPLILKAHEEALAEGSITATDDCSLVARMNHPIKIVWGDESNIKITTELDLFVAEQLIRLPGISSHELPSSTKSLQGKVYAVTGGTGGIGKALCALLKKEGAIPLPISTSSEPFKADLTSFAQTRQVFEKILQDFGPLDGLINSIGKMQVKNFLSLTEKDIQETLAANLNSVIFSCRCASLKKGAHILNIASSSYAKGRKGYMVYSAAKAAVVNFTQGLSEEFFDLQVNALVPQRTHTKMRLSHFLDEDRNTLLSPEQVAEAMVQLLKQEKVTGTIIEVRKQGSFLKAAEESYSSL